MRPRRLHVTTSRELLYAFLAREEDMTIKKEKGSKKGAIHVGVFSIYSENVHIIIGERIIGEKQERKVNRE